MNLATKTLLASVGVLALTIIHHLYGASLYDTPFRRHVALGILPVLLALILTYWVYRRHPESPVGRVSLWLFMGLTLVVPVGMIGLFEGGYNHLLKILVFFGGASQATFDKLFPPPTYEAPSDVWFEVTGALQLLVGLYAGYWLVRLWRAE